ncbi:MAG: AmmeMemoRadiSam system protein B [Acidobacteria bacterium]|nr:AmmeMemoRadiSam system protein B [Acidobacteriota bacterium]
MKNEREPAYAGQFYPGDPETLRRTVQSFFQKTDAPLQAKAVVVPHAGYIYSGSVTGKVLSAVQVPDRIILLGPSHTGLGESLALSPDTAWHTPLGTISIDSELNRNLLEACPDLREDTTAHLREHSLEVQVPFLQMIQPDCRISAICIGTADYASLEALGHGIAGAIRCMDSPVLLLASSDMTHYESAESAARKDQLAIKCILEIDPPGLYRTVMENNITMCGFAPAVSVLTACLDMGASAARLIDYTNSGEASGDYRQVVAYAGIAIE